MPLIACFDTWALVKLLAVQLAAARSVEASNLVRATRDRALADAAAREGLLVAPP